MARANRCYLPGHTYHLTHRCHGREFLFQFARDRDVYRRMLWDSLIKLPYFQGQLESRIQR